MSGVERATGPGEEELRYQCNTSCPWRCLPPVFTASATATRLVHWLVQSQAQENHFIPSMTCANLSLRSRSWDPHVPVRTACVPLSDFPVPVHTRRNRVT